MPVTVASLAEDLLVICGPFLAQVELDATTADATNPPIRMALEFAVERLGIATADAIDVADADLVDLTRAQLLTLRRLGEYEILTICRGNWAQFDQSAGEESQSLSQLTKSLDDRLAALREELGTLVTEPAAGTLPGPAAHGVIRAGVYCDTSRFPHDCSTGWTDWRGGFCR
jgi:hypothetical protein